MSIASAHLRVMDKADCLLPETEQSSNAIFPRTAKCGSFAQLMRIPFKPLQRDVQRRNKTETGRDVLFSCKRWSMMPVAALPSKEQSSNTTFSTRSFGVFGSMSRPHCGAVPVVDSKRQFVTSRFSVLIMLMACLW